MDLPPQAVGQLPSHPGGPGSADSSPRSAAVPHGEWDHEVPLPQVPGAKLRLMCSYGGHIIPRPHDKALSYVGGETRIVVLDRNSSLADLCTRLSRSLLDGRRFSLKYQLPNEDLDSLVSVSTDEDLDNMLDEYDRTSKGGGRLRLFLFLAKPDTAKTMGALLDDAKSETWFVDALNGANVLPRGLSDSAAIDDLLSLDSGSSSQQQLAPACSDAATQAKIHATQDVHSIQSMMPDSPMLETNTSSFDSSTSSPSMAHLPPIRVRHDNIGGTNCHPEDMRGGGLLDQHFLTQLNMAPPMPTTILTPSAVAVTNTATTTTTTSNNSNEGNLVLNRVASEEEIRSDHTAAPPVAAPRKPPLPLPLQPIQQRVISGNCGFNLPSPDSKHAAAGFNNLPSPDSVASDNSIASATSFTKLTLTQDPVTTQVSTLIDNNKLATTTTKPNTDPPKPDNIAPTYVYAAPPPQVQQEHQQHQPQYVQPNMHYIPTHAPIPSYYPVYATTQQPIHATQQVDPQQYHQMYLLPVPQTQPYNMPVQPTESARSTVQVQPQYVGYNMNPGARAMGGPGAGYANYDYGHDHQQIHHQQIYYTGQLGAATTAAPVGASQYQSITPAQAAMIAEASMQLPTTDSSKQPPRTS